MRALGEVLRDGVAREAEVLTALSAGPKTIPELATSLGAPESEVTLWVMALRRYGRVAALPKAATDDYYRYESIGGRR